MHFKWSCSLTAFRNAIGHELMIFFILVRRETIMKQIIKQSRKNNHQSCDCLPQISFLSSLSNESSKPLRKWLYSSIKPLFFSEELMAFRLALSLDKQGSENATMNLVRLEIYVYNFSTVNVLLKSLFFVPQIRWKNRKCWNYIYARKNTFKKNLMGR